MQVEEFRAKWEITEKILAISPFKLNFTSIDYTKIKCVEDHINEPTVCFACKNAFTPEDYIHRVTDYKFLDFFETMLGVLENQVKLNGSGTPQIKQYILESPRFNLKSPEMKQWPYLRGFVDMQVLRMLHA